MLRIPLVQVLRQERRVTAVKGLVGEELPQGRAQEERVRVALGVVAVGVGEATEVEEAVDVEEAAEAMEAMGAAAAAAEGVEEEMAPTVEY